ncbi:DctB [Vibrio orientalis CIP 102891 = ATCC 33934]|uniref:C4-dicarboxylate transport sensor protein DctB n=1 Tax=Vibrio orientalis CIP 102891 = ATCC 33934 TaxID=675816 RepID=C9QLR4_VIBOR|nr:ATP-binding protein [Vibrio orientalis]EEX92841.1 signal transduction histidine kinase regulating C4-dicarboxylate transport system [Vibrio orientalis CIP 102891 = ATCC 33934]EGU46521.1 DctB [Vibrio orientalis CIP 102891 = ATCC 33934]
MLTFQRSKFYLCILYIIVITLGASWVWNTSEEDQFDTHKEQLERFAEFISSKLDKYAHLPQLIAKDTEIISALQNPTNSAQIELTNRYLEQVNNTIQSTDAYLLDEFGNTIASSNWNLQRSFVGRNYAWRPYFSNAIQGQPSQYFALGSSSKQRGYYFSYPVTYAAEIIGVIVIKMDLTAIESNWQNKTNILVATDNYNVIFMSSNEEWLFKSLTTLSEAQRQTILNSRQYLDSPIRSFGFAGDLSIPRSELTNPLSTGFENSYLVSSRPLEKHDLTLRVLTPKATLLWSTLSFSLVTTLLFVIAYLSLQLTYQRNLKKRQFEQLQSEAKQKLEFLVMERTSELQAEVAERTKTEHALRQTQDELIQAAKLAVLGQMSASISHELNNPLAAIRSFADNGRRFLEKSKYDRVDDNLTRISALTDRMAKISSQLRSFAKKSDSDEITRADAAPIIFAAKELLAPQFKANQVTLNLDIEPNLPSIEINPIQLEQVLINLLTNAIQAIEDQQSKQIDLSVQYGNGKVEVLVDDNGPGIPFDSQAQLFEPFYTTKKNGLGLGLSISHQITQAMGGELSVTTSPLGGARFILAIPTTTQ